MTITRIGSPSDSAFRYGNPATVYDGAQLRANCRQLATVVTVTGAIDAKNVARISQYASRHVIAEKPLIIDLSGVTSFTTQGVSLLYALDEACDAAGVAWAMTASDCVRDALRFSADHADYPIANSVADALHRFADINHERRRLLPLFNKTA